MRYEYTVVSTCVWRGQDLELGWLSIDFLLVLNSSAGQRTWFYLWFLLLAFSLLMQILINPGGFWNNSNLIKLDLSSCVNCRRWNVFFFFLSFFKFYIVCENLFTSSSCNNMVVDVALGNLSISLLKVKLPIFSWLEENRVTFRIWACHFQWRRWRFVKLDQHNSNQLNRPFPHLNLLFCQLQAQLCLVERQLQRQFRQFLGLNQ